MMRGLVRNITIFINFLALFNIAVSMPRRFPLILMGIGLSLIAATLTSDSELATINPWKLGVGQGAFLVLVGAGVLLISRYVRTGSVVPVTVAHASALAYAVGALRYDSRAGLLVGVAAALIGTLFTIFQHLGRRAFVAILLGLMLLTPLYFRVYSTLAELGLFGEKTMKRMELIRDALDAENPLVASRQHTFDAIWSGIQALPWGLGSFPEGVSYHSHIVTALAEAGLIGLAFWFNIVIIAGGAVRRDLGRFPNFYLGLYCSLVILLSINLLFEPMQGYNRLLTPIYFATLVCFAPMVTARLRERRPLQLRRLRQTPSGEQTGKWRLTARMK
jgi:hypothetical protein